MICEDCVYFDGRHCEELLNDEGENIIPEHDLSFCDNFVKCLDRYEKDKMVH